MQRPGPVSVFRRILLFPIIVMMLASGVSALAADVVLNEYMASNGSFVPDEDGDHEDWIELYNRGENSIILEGYGLTDDPNRPFRWQFPRVSIAPGEFLIVWASGKDRRIPGANLHTNFSISAGGEPLQLTAADGRVVDFVPSRAVPRDISRGRKPDGTGGWEYFVEPTPGASNETEGVSGVTNPPHFSHSAGFYMEPFELELSHDDPGVVILYTLDGSVPSEANLDGMTYRHRFGHRMTPGDDLGPLVERELRSHAYDTPVTIQDRSGEANNISNLRSTFEREPGTFVFGETVFDPHVPADPIYKGVVVRARAVGPDAIPSETVTQSYFFRPDDSPRFTVPVVAITVSEDDFFDYHRGIYTAGEDFDAWRSSNPGTGMTPGRPGNFTRRGRGAERPGHLEWFDADGNRVLSQGAGFRIHGGWSRSNPRKSLRVYARADYGKSWFEHPFFDDFSEKTEFKRLLLRNGGNPMNHLIDPVATQIMYPSRAGVQMSQPVVQFINGEYWGVMYLRDRIDRYYVGLNYEVDPDNLLMFNAPVGRDTRLNRIDEGGTETRARYIELYDHITGPSFRRGDLEWVSANLDIDSYLDYYLMFIFINNGDWQGWKHFRFWRVREPDGSPYGDGRWRMIIWDFDGAARDDGPTAGRNDARDMIERSIDPQGSQFHNDPSRTAMLRGLLHHTEIRNRFINRLADHMNTMFSEERITEIVESEYARLAPSKEEHIARWSRSPGSRENVDRWIEFSQRRPVHVRNHLRDHFNVGADVTVSLDVTDPAGGYITMNTVDINPDTAGVPDPSYPWSGVYFENIPITVAAVPHEEYRFAGWVEYPGEFSDSITLDAVDGMQVTAIFEPLPERTLLYYWNFNNTGSLASPAFSLIAGGALVAELAAASELTHATGQGFDATNARFSDPAGSHLRLNNPIGSSITFQIPTTGYEHLLVQYETRRSGQGAGFQHIAYSLDGEAFDTVRWVRTENSNPKRVDLDLDSIPGAANNPDFALKITFQQGAGGQGGNNRFDNVTLEGIGTHLRSIYHRSEGTHNFGNGWKWTGLGYLYDTHYPFVYSAQRKEWIYVFGESEESYYFWSFQEGWWAWTARDLYPAYIILSAD